MIYAVLSLFLQYGGNQFFRTIICQFFCDSATQGIGVFGRCLRVRLQNDRTVRMADQAAQGQ